MLGTCHRIRLSDFERKTLMFDAQFLLFISFFLVISFNKKVIEWIKTEGENSLTKYSALSLECGNTIRDEEQEFEKYYFISMVSVLIV